MPLDPLVTQLLRTTWDRVADLGLPEGSSTRAIRACERYEFRDELVPSALGPYLSPAGAAAPVAAPKPPTEAELKEAQHPKLTSYAKYVRGLRQIHGALGAEIIKRRAEIRKTTARATLLQRIEAKAQAKSGAVDNAKRAASLKELETLQGRLTELRENLEPLEQLGRVLTQLRGERALDRLEVAIQVPRSFHLGKITLADGSLSGELILVLAGRGRLTGRDPAKGGRELAFAFNAQGIAGAGWTPVADKPWGFNFLVLPRFNYKKDGPGGGLGLELGPYVKGVGGLSFYFIVDDLDGLMIGCTYYATREGPLEHWGAGWFGIYRRTVDQGGARGIEFLHAPYQSSGFSTLIGHPAWTLIDVPIDLMGRVVLKVVRAAQKKGLFEDFANKLEAMYTPKVEPHPDASASERLLMGKKK